jgi:hypothetical protein
MDISTIEQEEIRLILMPLQCVSMHDLVGHAQNAFRGINFHCVEISFSFEGLYAVVIDDYDPTTKDIPYEVCGEEQKRQTILEAALFPISLAHLIEIAQKEFSGVGFDNVIIRHLRYNIWLSHRTHVKRLEEMAALIKPNKKYWEEMVSK